MLTLVIDEHTAKILLNIMQDYELCLLELKLEASPNTQRSLDEQLVITRGLKALITRNLTE